LAGFVGDTISKSFPLQSRQVIQAHSRRFINMTKALFTLGILLFLASFGIAQKLVFEPSELDFGTVESAGSMRSRLTIRNTGDKPLFLLRADAPPNFEVFTSRKKVMPGDTVHLRFTYTPRQAGRFSETIGILHNGSSKPSNIRVKGELKNLLSNDLAACVNFEPKTDGSQGNASIPLLARHQVFVTDAKTGKPIQEATVTYVSRLGREKAVRPLINGSSVNMVPIGPYAMIVTSPGYNDLMVEEYIPTTGKVQNYLLTISPDEKQPEKVLPEVLEVIEPEIIPLPPVEPPVIVADAGELDVNLYRPNNLIFLIDVSGSMKDSDKLPLLKKALGTLLEPVRAIDNISIITYSDEARIVVPTTTGAEKRRVASIVDTLKAGGLTAGSKGLNEAYLLANQSYIPQGNNQIILATDGAFRVSQKDRRMIEASAKDLDRPIVLSVVAFGNKENALDMLAGLSKLGGGSAMEVRKASQAENVLLDEIKKRSLK
jgi:Ca-activated chloride channel homolog